MPDHDLLTSSLAFWNSSRNTFDFRLGPASPTMLDMAVVFGLKIEGRVVDLLNDYQHTPSNNLETTVIFVEKIPEKEFGTIKAYSKHIPYIIQRFRNDIDQQHIWFLNMFLCRFLFPNCSKNIIREFLGLAEALHVFDDVALGPFVLANIYQMMYKITLRNPYNLLVPGPFWMIQVWLRWFFPEFRSGEIDWEDKDLNISKELLWMPPLKERNLVDYFAAFTQI